MEDILLHCDELKKFFKEKNYNCVKPYSIINNNDTVFVSAGIQPLLLDYREKNLNDSKKLYVAQPVIRTQYSNSVEEGSSIAFTNLTTASFNHSEEEHNGMVKDWYELLYKAGIDSNDITINSDIYETKWGDLELCGKRTFHYYKEVEIGDTTFFTKVIDDNSKKVADSMSDLGFGLERLRWLINGNSYYDLYSNSQGLDSKLKAYLSVLALLAVNNIKPSNKNSGYRSRMFSKKLVNLLEGRNLNLEEERYLDECVEYWKEWQEQSRFQDKQMVVDEFIRNGNRYILDKLANEGFDNLSGININISRAEFEKRLIGSGANIEKIKKLVR